MRLHLAAAFAAIMLPALAGCSLHGPDMAREGPAEATGKTLIHAGNETESTILRYRGNGWWDEISTEDGSVRFSFEETGRTETIIEMTDETRNGGLSLRIDLERGVIDLSEGAGRPYYQRYTITEVG